MDGVTPSVGRVLEAVDNEKIAIAKALKITPRPLNHLLREYYGAEGSSLFEVIRNTNAYKDVKAPSTMQMRYLTEDVPHGLVPIASIGDMIGVSAPTMKSVIKLASVVNGVDYWREGRTVEKLGLSGLSCEEMIRFVTYGKI
jgi:opine dehydrogenase